MKKIIFFLVLAPFISNCQVSKNIIFGIDLNLDWYTLTNYSGLTYAEASLESKNNYVVIDLNQYKDKIDNKFLKLGFSELLLAFPKKETRNLNELKPEIFIARIRYSDYSDYMNKSPKDLENILFLMRDEFGEANLNEVRDKYSNYKWSGVYYDIALTCREDELAISFFYLKN